MKKKSTKRRNTEVWNEVDESLNPTEGGDAVDVSPGPRSSQIIRKLHTEGGEGFSDAVHRTNPLYRKDSSASLAGQFEVVSSDLKTVPDTPSLKEPEEVFGFGGGSAAAAATSAAPKAASEEKKSEVAADDEAAKAAAKAERGRKMREARERRKKEEWDKLMDALSVIDTL